MTDFVKLIVVILVVAVLICFPAKWGAGHYFKFNNNTYAVIVGNGITENGEVFYTMVHCNNHGRALYGQPFIVLESELQP